MSWTLSGDPVESPAEDRMAAVSTREAPLTTIDSGVEQAPGAVSWAYKGAALAATSATIYVAIFRIAQIYTIGFSIGPAVVSFPIRQKKAAGELLFSRGPQS
jgi:hypothetical protein